MFAAIREAPFLNVMVHYGHCRNSFRPPPLCQTGKCGKKVHQTILASLYTPGQRGKKVPQTILASLYTPGQTWGKKCLEPSWQDFTPAPLWALPI